MAGTAVRAISGPPLPSSPSIPSEHFSVFNGHDAGAVNDPDLVVLACGPEAAIDPVLLPMSRETAMQLAHALMKSTGVRIEIDDAGAVIFSLP